MHQIKSLSADSQNQMTQSWIGTKNKSDPDILDLKLNLSYLEILWLTSQSNGFIISCDLSGTQEMEKSCLNNNKKLTKTFQLLQSKKNS